MSHIKRSVHLADRYGNDVDSILDGNTNAVKMISYEHHEIHDGSSFTTDFSVDLANGASMDVQLTTPNTTAWAHMIYTCYTEAEAEFNLYEAPTTTGGTGLVEQNRDRNSATAATVVAVHTPSVSGTGTLIRTKHYGTGKTQGGQVHETDEWILKQNTKYLFRLTNATTSANYCTLMISWYEHTNK